MLHPLMIAGGILFTVGSMIFAAKLFANGGFARSAQFRVLDELLKGVHGKGTRSAVVLSLLMMPLGACLLFGGVAASDQERAERCDAHCKTAGFTTSRIGTNPERDKKDQSTWFIACICGGSSAGDEGSTLIVDADELPKAN